MIESVNNERVKYWAKLKEKKYQDSEGLFIVEGEHLVLEARDCGLLKEVIVLEENENSFENAIVVSEPVMRKISSLTNIPKVIGIAHKLVLNEIAGNVLLLDRIQDPGNMGTIIRSCVAFGIGTLIVGKNSVSIYNPKVVRASEGMMFHLNIVEADIESILPILKENGYKIYVTDVNGGSELSNIEFSDLSAIVIGNEGAGVSDDIISLADSSLYIKMCDECESLNAGIATSIILYELYTRKNI